MTYSELKEVYNDIKNDKIMAKALRVLIITLAAWIIIETPWYFIDKAAGKHDKFFFGLGECNIPKDHPDTVTKTVIKRITDTVYKIEKAKKTFYNKIKDVQTLNQN